jgi:hypothetical protein
MSFLRAVARVAKVASEAREPLCPSCKGPLTNSWPAYPGARHCVCGNCAIR